MTEALAGEADRLRRAAEQVGDLGSRLAGEDPGATAFGSAAPGQLGALASELRGLWVQSLHARAQEAAAHAARLDQLADAVRRAAGGYGDIDHASGRRTSEVQ